MRITAVLLFGILAIFLTASAANAGIGQSAGPLEFKEIPPGQSKTLTYAIINPNPQPLKISAQLDGDFQKYAEVSPKTVTIPASTNIELEVTFHMPSNATLGTQYEGSVLVSEVIDEPRSGGTGGVATILVAAQKSGTAVAGIPDEVIKKRFELSPILYMTILAAIVIVAAIFVYARRKKA